MLNGYIKLLKQQLVIIASSNYSYLYKRGGYQYLVRDRLKEFIDLQNKTSLNKDENSSISEINLQYLEKCISLCTSNNIKVYLGRSPMHPSYLAMNNEQLFQTQIQTRFKTVEFLDFKNCPLSNDDFGDLEHLNYRGARKYSIWFNDLLDSGLLNVQNKQEYINDKMKK